MGSGTAVVGDGRLHGEHNQLSAGRRYCAESSEHRVNKRGGEYQHSLNAVEYSGAHAHVHVLSGASWKT